MPVPIPIHETRSPDRVRHHYLIEKELAARLRAAPKEERRHLYTALYDELFRKLPDHPQLALKKDAHARQSEVSDKLKLLQKYLRADMTYLEIGPGDCALAAAVAGRVDKVLAVDVSREIAGDVALPANLELVISDGCSIPVLSGSVDLAYSDQLMEHLHPDDALDQLRNVYQALGAEGGYICITPNRWSGPHDVSRYFDEVATGFHLREYTVTELAGMFKEVGFRRLRVLIGVGGFQIAMPSALVQGIEFLLQKSPRKFARAVARRLPLRVFLGVRLLARK